jgi:tetratricopeptide (TPR) repeat protein
MPTVLDCLQISSKAHTSGQSLQPALQRRPLESRPCYSQTTSAFSAFGWAPLKSITTDAWKYIESTRDELYDLQQDPGERHNLAQTNAPQARQMQQLLADVETELAVVEIADTELSDADRRALLALGYVGGSGNTAPAANGEPLPDVKDMIRFYNADMAARRQMSSGQREAAIAALQQTITEAPEFLPARLTLAAAYQMQDRLDDAAAVYEEALRLAPDSHDANFDFATLLAGRGETESAIRHYRAAIKARPSAATAHVNLATLLYASGDIPGARQSFAAGLQAFPDSIAGQFNYGVFLAEQGELDAGVEHVERAAALNPRNPQIQFRLGELLVQQGRFGAAAERFATTLQLHPRYPKAAEQLAEAERRAAGP